MHLGTPRYLLDLQKLLPSRRHPLGRRNLTSPRLLQGDSLGRFFLPIKLHLRSLTLRYLRAVTYRILDSVVYLFARLLHIVYQLRPILEPSRCRCFAFDPSLDGAFHLLGIEPVTYRSEQPWSSH